MRYEPDVISKNIKRNRRIKRVFLIILYLLLIPTIIFSVFLLVLELGNSDEDSSSFDIEVYTISSDSMSPKLNVNDIIVVKKGYEFSNYKVGNIITFINEDNELITHRITGIITDGFVTKGDNNEVEDLYPVDYENVIGKVIYIMPMLGSFLVVLKNKFFLCACIIILILITCYDIRVKRRKIERKTIREKYEKKSNFYFNSFKN